LLSALTKNDVLQASNELNLTSIAANQILSFVEREKENTDDDAYRVDIENELVFLRAGDLLMFIIAVPQVILKAKQMLNHIGQITKEESVDLQRTVNALTKGIQSGSKVIRDYKGLATEAIIIPTINLLSVVVSPVPVVEPTVPHKVEVSMPFEFKVDSSAAPLEISVTNGVITFTDEEQKRILEDNEKIQDGQLRALSAAIKEIIIVNEEAPKVLTQTEAEADPIKVLYIILNVGCWPRVEGRGITLGH
jgi:hypothetical protein